MEFTWDKLINTLENENEAVLATILQKKGSAPRGAGTMMLIHKDGKIDGTIGGGPVEKELIEICTKLIKEKKSIIKSVNFTGEDVICGGNVLISLEYFSKENLNFFKKLYENFQNGKKQLIIKNLNSLKNSLIDISDTKNPAIIEGELNKEVLETVKNNFKEKFFIEEIDGVKYFFQLIETIPEIHIFGAGHIASPLYEIARICQFKVYIYDDREEFAKKERFPEAEKVILTPMEEVEKHINFHNSCYFVLVTREHKHDEIVLKQLLGKPYAYIGMIGSKRRVKSVKERIIKEGFSEEEVNKIYSPIGLDIGAETPAEIAVSIIAEIIKVKNELS